MIGMLHGTIVEKSLESVIVDVGGLGYEVFVPGSALVEIGSVGERVKFRTHLDVKEDSLQLYGFTDRRELDMFKLLISVGQIGPRIGLNILSMMDVPTIVGAIANSDEKAFTAVSGIGKKTAQRIFLDIGEKVGKHFASESLTGAVSRTPGPKGGSWELARQGLAAMGFRPSEVEARVAYARGSVADEASPEDIIKEALRFS